MKNYQRDFIKFALEKNVIQFGDFTLKSGRRSPYFFNMGLFNTGSDILKLAKFYAKALQDSTAEYDVLFGPAYKGIPLASATSLILSQNYQKNIGVCYNRKEKKNHGEGGDLVGYPLADKKVVIIDDVITAGTAIIEAIKIIQQADNASLAGIIIALDRMEQAPDSNLSTIDKIQQQYNTKIITIITLKDIINYLPTSDIHKSILQNHLDKNNTATALPI
ncbi:MAG: orotate phosphoribosyltransferase [Gammaproteobacteria bacterium]|nr:MAG: orotate phosphoribosyltransferase [Gammaproteobacteria bacterium]